MSLFGSEFDKVLDQACSEKLLEPDYYLNTRLCDMLRQKEVKAASALSSMRRKINPDKPMVALLAFTLLEMCVANCGDYFVREVATRSFMDQMKDWAMPGKFQEKVTQRVLELIQNWAVGFKSNSAYQPFQDTFNSMRSDGFVFPECHVTEATYKVDQAPEWIDAEQCYKCRGYFGTFNRKHHCRNCGQIFCQQCSSKEAAIPRFGYEKPVRVCDRCYDALGNGTGEAAATTETAPVARGSVMTVAEAEALRRREEDELAAAIAASLQDTGRASWQDTSSPKVTVQNEPAPPVQVKVQAEEPLAQNSELAAYLARGSGKAQATAAAQPTAVAASVEVEPSSSDDGDEQLIAVMGRNLKLLDSKLRNAEASRRNVALDQSIKALYQSNGAMLQQLIDALEANEQEKLQYLEMDAKIQRIIDTRAALIETRRKHREEQELLQRMQLEQKLKLMQQQEQYQRFQQQQMTMQYGGMGMYGMPQPAVPVPGAVPGTYAPAPVPVAMPSGVQLQYPQQLPGSYAPPAPVAQPTYQGYAPSPPMPQMQAPPGPSPAAPAGQYGYPGQYGPPPPQQGPPGQQQYAQGQQQADNTQLILLD
eukprot:comp22852_c0_seq1/m.36033 comp22852_c0_seq1/g.36033  ORF comp22852_c0_seq1/g.36033 comp22852_c0_seq1/m.36033 type:complete len:592 (-) comp22852_c0_seq1:296-2071(-)